MITKEKLEKRYLGRRVKTPSQSILDCLNVHDTPELVVDPIQCSNGAWYAPHQLTLLKEKPKKEPLTRAKFAEIWNSGNPEIPFHNSCLAQAVADRLGLK